MSYLASLENKNLNSTIFTFYGVKKFYHDDPFIYSTSKPHT